MVGATVNVHAHPRVVPLPMFTQFIDEHGVFRGNDAANECLTKQLDELHKWTTVLQAIRPEQKSIERKAA